MDADDDLVRIEPGGRLEVLGTAAALRLQAREGLFHVLPAPPQLVVLREDARDPIGTDRRACRLSGEIGNPGALCDIVGFLDQAAWKGELVVFEGSGMRSLYFEQGNVVGASSTVPNEHIGQILFRFGVLSQEQVTRCLDDAASTLRFGEAAVKLGFLQREKLFELMARQTEEIFYEALRVEQGVFYFLDSFDETCLSARQMLAVAGLIREGVRRMHETRFFRARIPSSRHVPVPKPGNVPKESDPRVYAVIDGKRSVADICRLLGESEFVVTRTIFQLVQRGFVTIQSPHVEPDEMVEIGNRAISLILRELDAIDEGDAVRAQLAMFAEKGVYPKLFAGARKGDSAMLVASVVLKNAEGLQPTTRWVEQLESWLREYTDYALFLARPHLQRADGARGGKLPQPGQRISQRVAAILEPITTNRLDRPGR